MKQARTRIKALTTNVKHRLEVIMSEDVGMAEPELPTKVASMLNE